jgi:hypothetical protein
LAVIASALLCNDYARPATQHADGFCDVGVVVSVQFPHANDPAAHMLHRSVVH